MNHTTKMIIQVVAIMMCTINQLTFFSSVFTFLEENIQGQGEHQDVLFDETNATSSSGEERENEENETSNEESEESHHEEVVLRRST
jgi:hypothetical protein